MKNYKNYSMNKRKKAQLISAEEKSKGEHHKGAKGKEKLVVDIKFQKFQKKMTKKKYSVLIELIEDKLSSERKNSTTTKI